MERFYIVIILVEVAAVNAGSNVALNKPAKVSSQYNSIATADKAVDGNLAQKFNEQSCFHTKTTTNNWWLVNLEKNYTIQNVTLYNRQDCCASRARELKILVGNCLGKMKEVAFIDMLGSIGSVTMPENTTGKYVKILQKIPEGEVLHLCEVQVFSEDS